MTTSRKARSEGPRASPAYYWFPAKRYGYGWGLPVRWQGWVVFAVYVLSLMLISFLWPPGRSMLAFQVGLWTATAMLAAICYWKGEPPRWRWG